jgi:hypothetical protein
VDWPLEDDGFKLKVLPFSFGRDPEPLARSIQKQGLLRPLWGVIDPEGRPVIVSGGLRVAALKLLGQTTAPTYLLTQDPHWLDVWTLALADNLGKTYNPAEKALILAALSSTLTDPEMASLTGLMDLPIGKALKERNLAAAKLPYPALLALAKDKLDLATGARLAQLGPDALGLWTLLEGYNPSLQTRRKWVDWLIDLSRLEKRAPLDLAQEIGATLANPPSFKAPNLGPAKTFEGLLKSWRFPKVTFLEAQRLRLLKSAPLPPGVSLTTDPSLEDLKATLTIQFSGPDDLAARLKELKPLLNNPNFQKIWKLKWPEDEDLFFNSPTLH